MSDLPANADTEKLYRRISDIVEAARTHVARSVNLAMVQAYWHIGREVVEHEQGGDARAEYGRHLVRLLSQRLGERFGGGFSSSNIWRMRQFYLVYPSGSPTRGLLQAHASAGEAQILAAAPREFVPPWFPSTLGWTHYTLLMRVQDSNARTFYEIEAAREGWSTRELDRQIASMLFERLSLSRNEEQVRELARQGQQVDVPRDILKDPLVLEFLDLAERDVWQERDLEQAIIDRLEQFLLELGKGFCFVGRQRRLSLDGDHFYVDLVFYNRLLRCFVLVDLKLGKLTHQDLGQMQMYVNWYDRFQREEWEQPTVGVVLCSEKNDAMVRITLPEDNQQILAARYQLFLPTEEELRAQLIAERERVEMAAKVAAMWEE